MLEKYYPFNFKLIQQSQLKNNFTSPLPHLLLSLPSQSASPISYDKTLFLLDLSYI